MGHRDSLSLVFSANPKVFLVYVVGRGKEKSMWKSGKHLYLFAKTGFTKGCVDKATEMGNVTLVEFDEMI